MRKPTWRLWRLFGCGGLALAAVLGDPVLAAETAADTDKILYVRCPADNAGVIEILRSSSDVPLELNRVRYDADGQFVSGSVGVAEIGSTLEDWIRVDRKTETTHTGTRPLSKLGQSVIEALKRRGAAALASHCAAGGTK